MEYFIQMFLKFGSYEHMKDLYDNGTIYINTIEFFRAYEDCDLRGDTCEGALSIINSLPGTFRIPNIDEEFKFEKVQLIESYKIIFGNLFCLYCISSHGFSNPLEVKIDERNKAFGTHCVLIKDNKYFLNTIRDKLKKHGYKFDEGFVKYYDKDSISKKLTMFDKPNIFEYQKEFRFYVYNNKVEPIVIEIGSLHNIAELLPIETALTLSITKKNHTFDKQIFL